jgi:hypothetical protein
MKVINISNNHVEIKKDGERFFQSYATIVAKITSGGEIIMDNYMKGKCSPTTKRHLIKWLGTTTKELNKKLKAGVFKFEELN